MGSMASAAANDVRMGLTNKFGGQAEEADYRRRTEASVARMNAPSAADKEDDRPRHAALPMTVSAPNYNIAPVAAAPTVPDPDAIGETEQALLDAQKKGRSSTIQTSARGLLSDEDSTRKKRSLMGGLIS